MGSVGNLYNYEQKILGSDSYTYTNKQLEQDRLFVRSNWEDLRNMEQERSKLYEQLNKEVVKIEGLNKALSAALGSYTDKGNEILADIKELDSQINPLRKQIDEAHERMDKIDKEEFKKQIVNWNTPKANALSQKDYPGFKLDTGTPYVEQALKEGRARIVEMTPLEYLRRSAYDIHNSSLEREVRGGVGWDTERYAKEMRKTKFYMPYLDYSRKQQEGRHRAVAAFINGYKKIPVVIIE